MANQIIVVSLRVDNMFNYFVEDDKSELSNVDLKDVKDRNLLNAIFYCLFDQTLDEDAKDSVVTPINDAPFPSVDINLNVDGKEFNVNKIPEHNRKTAMQGNVYVSSQKISLNYKGNISVEELKQYLLKEHSLSFDSLKHYIGL